MINGDLHRSKRISSNFNQQEVNHIKEKYIEADFPKRFINSVVNDFLSIPKDEEMIISTWLFDERSTVLLYLPYSRKNEEYTKSFISRINKFTNNKFNIKIIWQTRKIRSIFKLKDKVKHISDVIYKG